MGSWLKKEYVWLFDSGKVAKIDKVANEVTFYADEDAYEADTSIITVAIEFIRELYEDLKLTEG